jgi:membrane-associated phospholipid phosphatase
MKIILFLFLISVSSTHILGDSTKVPLKPKTTILKDLGSDLGIFATDWGAFLTCPLRMDTKDLIVNSAVFGATILTSTIDDDVRNEISRHGFNTYNNDILDVPTFYGYVQYPSILGGVMYAFGLFARIDWFRTTGRELIQALVYGGTVTIGLRYAFARRRPSTSVNNQYEFDWFEADGELQAFPSGHMVVAASTSTIFAEKIDTWWARAILYPFALWTGFARMRNDKHWLSDIIFGAALGYGSAKFVLNQEERRELEEKKSRKSSKSKKMRFNLIPTLNGISVTLKF